MGAPDRIWAESARDELPHDRQLIVPDFGIWNAEPERDGSHAYVRADLADALAEAARGLLALDVDGSEAIVSRAALRRLHAARAAYEEAQR